jgi:hypothetical protein
MAEVGITAIVVGAILFALGFFPGLVAALVKRLQNFWNPFLSSRGDIHRFLLSSEVWLLAGGGVILIVGLLAFLEK